MSESRSISLSKLATIRSIQTLFENEESWCDFFFHHRDLALRLSARDLLEEAQACEKGDQLLVQVALDIWSSEGGARIVDLLTHFDDEQILLFIKALLELRGLDVEELVC